MFMNISLFMTMIFLFKGSHGAQGQSVSTWPVLWLDGGVSIFYNSSPSSSLRIRSRIHTIFRMSVCAHLWYPSPFVSTIWCSRPYKPYIFWKLIIWWWQWPRRRLTKRQIQRQRHTYTDKDKYKVLPRPNVCYIFEKQGVKGYQIGYFLQKLQTKESQYNILNPWTPCFWKK